MPPPKTRNGGRVATRAAVDAAGVQPAPVKKPISPDSTVQPQQRQPDEDAHSVQLPLPGLDHHTGEADDDAVSRLLAAPRTAGVEVVETSPASGSGVDST